jgi:hypothetical protein
MTDDTYNPRKLPETVADLLAQRRSLKTRSLHDDVDECHLKLWTNPEYRRCFFAVHASETIEGSFIADEHMAAGMIRTFAKANNIPIAAETKIAAIVYSLNVVCRRYNMSRKDRQNRVHGQRVDEAAE